MNKLDELRTELDALDNTIVALLDQRLQLADQIAEWKSKNRHLIEDQEREHQVFAHVKQAAIHPVLKERIEEIYQPIIECSKMVQRMHKGD
jgi:chorismate mutase